MVVVLDYWMGFHVKTGRCARTDHQRDHRPVISVFFLFYFFFLLSCFVPERIDLLDELYSLDGI